MKRATVVLLLLGFLLATALTGCSNSSTQLQDVLANYSKAVAGDLPEDIRLTIYYLDSTIFTRVPLSAEDLTNFPGVKKIVIGYEELETHLELLREVEPSILQPVKDPSGINARLYYAFEVGDSNKLLEVTISQIHGNAFVNGIEVEDNPIFYELIIPFLSEEAHNILGI